MPPRPICAPLLGEDIRHATRLHQRGDTMGTDMTGRSVIVTGGTRGIGYGIAEVFAEAGAFVTIVGRDPKVAAEAAKRLSGDRDNIGVVLADVSRPAECARMAEEVLAARGAIDVLCANAGMFPAVKLADMTEADFDAIFDLNVKGCVFSVQACLPALAAGGRGRVVLTSSITGPVTGFPGWSHYGASKAAQLGFLRTAALELAPKGITVNAVLPGTVLTDALRDLGDEFIEGVTAVIPLKRVGDPRDIGHAALFFASDEAGYITGQALVIDGGQTLPETPDALAAAEA
jgi:3-oxoacyl-[acyl-carrier protein] reductase